MSFLDFIYPKFCLGCGKFGSYCCNTCLCQSKTLPYLTCPICGYPSNNGKTHTYCHTRFGLDGLISMYPYQGIIKKAIKQVKYRYAYRIIDDLLNSETIKCVEAYMNAIPAQTVIIPIPLHISRLYTRGFNQSELIAQRLGRHYHYEVHTHLLERIRKTVPQVEMKSRDERIKNIQSAFVVSQNFHVQKYSSVLLVDDVYTTGATIKSAACTLKKYGIKRVWGFTLAQ